jgi:Tfp pilus assembly protein PilF
VLLRTRRGRRPNRRRFYASNITWIIPLLLISITGCQDKRASLEKQYAEARLSFQQGYIDQPLPLAEAGYKASTKYPDLNWKFRVLTSDVRNRMGRFAEALHLLVPENPSNIFSEILWRRRITQGLSLCQLGKYRQAEERFAQAENLQAEPGALNYARGRCAMTKHEAGTAEHFLRLVTAQNSNPDPFLRAYALATLGRLAEWDFRYEDAIDLNKECLPIVRTLHAAALEELVLGNLGDLYVQLRDFNNAIQNAQAAEKIAAQWKLLSDQQKWLFDIGFAQDIQGQSGKAEQSYNRALSIATQLGDKDIAAKCLRQLTALKLRQHQIDVAQRYHDQESKLGLQQ